MIAWAPALKRPFGDFAFNLRPTKDFRCSAAIRWHPSPSTMVFVALLYRSCLSSERNAAQMNTIHHVTTMQSGFRRLFRTSNSSLNPLKIWNKNLKAYMWVYNSKCVEPLKKNGCFRNIWNTNYDQIIPKYVIITSSFRGTAR